MWVHPTDICNGKNDCTSGEDEYLCDLPRKYPGSCNCSMYAISCMSSRSVQGLLELIRAPLVYNHFGHVKIELHSRIHVSNNVLVIESKNSKLSNICFTFGFKQLRFLDYSHNNTFQITDHYYKNTSLNVINLSQNKLKHISNKAFYGLHKMIKGCLSRGVCLGGCLPRGCLYMGDVYLSAWGCAPRPFGQNSWHTLVNTLPFRNFVRGR